MAKFNVGGVESVLFSLRTLYNSYGYTEYKMNKFEEYDLYVKNKDFLISDNVITFTDTNGKLLALKPDVTLSIIKNTKIENGVTKVFYNENVYRVSSKSNGYKEIPQTGLECIGELDKYNISEVIFLATESLKNISENCVLDISPVGIVYSCVESLDVNSNVKKLIYKCINEKNLHEITQILENEGVSKPEISTLKRLVSLHGDIDSVINEFNSYFKDSKLWPIVEEFIALLEGLSFQTKQIIKIDCSSCENVKYYNGITFKGYIEGVPKAVLSGGRYDGLLKMMGKKCGAIGFAIYPDEFDRMFIEKKEYDVDVVVIYNDKTDLNKITETVNSLIQEGKIVTALKQAPEKITYKEIITL